MFQLSPGVNVSEIDLTTVIPSVASSIGAFAGVFAWGPVDQVVTITDEIRLADNFGKPNSDNYEYWFSAANFLSYSNNLKLVRAYNANTTFNATSAFQPSVSAIDDVTIETAGENYANGFIVFAGGDPVSGNVANASVEVDANGSIIAITINSGGAYLTPDQIVATVDHLGGTGAILGGSAVEIIPESDLPVLIKNRDDYEQNFADGDSTYGSFAAKYAGAIGNSISVHVADSATYSTWIYRNSFTDAPSTSDSAQAKGSTNDELHVVVVDRLGQISGRAGTILEKYEFVSKMADAKTIGGNTNYYKDVINNRSRYIWSLAHPEGMTNWGNVDPSTTYTSLSSAISAPLGGGSDGTIQANDIVRAYDNVSNKDSVDISLIITGPSGETINDYLIQNIAEERKDCVVFISPLKSDVVDNVGNEADAVLTTRSALSSSSFAVMDSGWKYQYDKYNDVYRWVPLNADIAGLCARTDLERDPWFSPAGLNRGSIKNAVKLAWNPTKAERDDLYVKGINPVVTFQGEGTVLFGDKTMLSRPSAFDRINVRRLFIVIEKAIARASRSSLFEFNDQFTRAQFVNLVEPYLRDVQGRRGITDFRVVCDETNNTPEVIDRNEFIGDIYIRPTRSINFIQLNFVATRTGVSFDEIVGSF